MMRLVCCYFFTLLNNRISESRRKVLGVLFHSMEVIIMHGFVNDVDCIYVFSHYMNELYIRMNIHLNSIGRWYTLHYMF